MVSLPSVKRPGYEIEQLWGIQKEALEETYKDHGELEGMYRLYYQFRFQWQFSYWLFKQPKSIDSCGQSTSNGRSIIRVYHDTLEGVYRVLTKEMHTTLIDFEHFWQVAKIQMARECKLEETAVNYVNWKMVDSVPYYRLYMVSRNSVYLDHLKGFLQQKRLMNN